MLAGLAALLAVLVGPASPASAHAALVETYPVDGQALASGPDEILLSFNEAIVAIPGGVRVFTTDGSRVDDGTVAVDPADSTRLLAGVESDLAEAPYVVTWRAVSADGHPVRGAFVFTVGDGATASDDVVAALFGGGDNPAVGAVATLARAAGYAGTLVALGAAAFLVVVARRRTDRLRAAQSARSGAVVGLAAGVLAVPLQAMVVTGLGFAALAPSTLWDVARGSVGQSAVLRIVALVAMLLVARAALVADESSIPNARANLLLGLGALAALSFVLEGHTRTQEPTLVIVGADVVHVLTAAVWTGGLVVLAQTLRSRRRADDPVGAAHLLRSFSRLAMVSVLVAVAAGVAQSWVTVRAARALTSTTYGWVVLGKSALVVALLAIGFHNQRRLVPAVVRAAMRRRETVLVAGGSADAPAGVEEGSVAPPAVADDGRDERGDEAWDRLRRTVRVEVVGVLLVLFVTAGLVNLQPAAQEAGITGAFTTTVDLGEAGRAVNLVVDPNRVGQNAIHLYVLDETGRPTSDVTDVQVAFTMPAEDIGPIEREPFIAGPGHWQVDGNVLSVPGEWVISVSVEIGRFDLETVDVAVVVNQ